MDMEDVHGYTAFVGSRRLTSGRLTKVLADVKSRFDRDRAALMPIFDDETGRQVDFDLRGTVDDVLARAIPEPARAGRGRPRLGVISREVTLLPRHWEWLERQPNGASAGLRRLVDEARKREPEKERVRLGIDAVGRFLSAIAGNLPGYEEATRALYRHDRARFDRLIRGWPKDIRLHTRQLARNLF